MIYIGHLDLLKLFQRAIRRAKLPIAYSAGFNPHQLVSFALPLSIGYSSVNEYADIEFTQPIDTIGPLNTQMPEGLRIISLHALQEGARPAAALVSAAAYELSFPFPIPQDAIALPESIFINKKTKSGEAVTDIRPDIISLNTIDDYRLKAVLSAGSGRNLKPALLTEYIYLTLRVPYEPFAVKFKRLELLTQVNGRYVSLNDSAVEI